MLLRDLIKLVENIRIDCTKDFMTGPYDKPLLDMIAYYLDRYYNGFGLENQLITKKTFSQVAKMAQNEITGSWEKVIEYLKGKCND